MRSRATWDRGDGNLSGQKEDGQVNASEAAKACMANIAKLIEEFYPTGGPAWINIEREFTEIISQVTPPTMEQKEAAWMASQKQKNLDMWLGRNLQARHMQNQPAAYSPADASNAQQDQMLVDYMRERITAKITVHQITTNVTTPPKTSMAFP